MISPVSSLERVAYIVAVAAVVAALVEVVVVIHL